MKTRKDTEGRKTRIAPPNELGNKKLNVKKKLKKFRRRKNWSCSNGLNNKKVYGRRKNRNCSNGQKNNNSSVIKHYLICEIEFPKISRKSQKVQRIREELNQINLASSTAQLEECPVSTRQFEMVAKAKTWSEEEKPTSLFFSLRGQALVLLTLPEQKIMVDL